MNLALVSDLLWLDNTESVSSTYFWDPIFSVPDWHHHQWGIISKVVAREWSDMLFGMASNDTSTKCWFFMSKVCATSAMPPKCCVMFCTQGHHHWPLVTSWHKQSRRCVVGTYAKLDTYLYSSAGYCWTVDTCIWGICSWHIPMEKFKKLCT